jgi:hypothetical protein
MIEMLATMFGQILRLWHRGTKGAKLHQGLIIDNVALMQAHQMYGAADIKDKQQRRKYVRQRL